MDLSNLKCVILAGGLGTRISEETQIKPKPMVEIGGKPIIWHIMNIYSSYGIKNFIICCGYKGYVIKEYFANYRLHINDVTIFLKDNKTKIIKKNKLDWEINLVDTGDDSMTGGRLLNIKDYLDKDNTFLFTYGDCVGNVKIDELIKFHKEQGKLATLTAVQPPGRFGALNLKGNSIIAFNEKPQGDNLWVNGGFFVLEPEVLNLIDNDQTIWEQEPLQRLAKNNQLNAYKHYDFWQPMDTLRDKMLLNELWNNNDAKWKTW